jgi:hypothetical protein
MLKRLDRQESWARAGVVALLVCVLIPVPSSTLAQSSQLNSPSQTDPLPDIVPNATPIHAKEKHSPARVLGDRLPDKPSLVPIFSVPLDTLGFTAPGAIYLGQRNRMVSLDFLGDDQLLFTFRVPGLIHRENGHQPGEDERQIRAVVVDVKTGRVQAEALWTLHDRTRYLWVLRDGHFLLRDRDLLQLGDSSLVLKPVLQFPGTVDWLELDPQQLFIVTNSYEPLKTEAKPGQVDSPPTASATIEADGQDPSALNDTVVRILERSTGKVMLVSRVRATVHLPINADGYLERLRGNGWTWSLNLNYFTGGSRIVGRVESSCAPAIDFVSQNEFLATGCAAGTGTRLTAFSTDGRWLWEDDATSAAIWPVTVMSLDGSRLARETLQVSRPINASNPIDTDDLKGQLVRVINAADGSIAFEATAHPMLDAGGNVAISANGNRVALLSDGAIQIFDLPPAPVLPASASH